MNKNGGKHHIYGLSPNACSWLLMSMLHPLPQNVYGIPYLKTNFYSGGGSGPWEVKCCSQHELEERRKTIKSKQTD